MSEPIHCPSNRRFLPFIPQIACVVFGLSIGACGSSGSGNEGGASGHGSGGAIGDGGTGGGTGGKGGASSRGGAGGKTPMPGTPCSTNQDCGSFALTCRAPGEFLGCGTCQQGKGNCGSDTDCAADAGTSAGKLICDPAPNTSCFCSSTFICVAGCRTKSDCPSNQGCNRRHQCQNSCVPGDGTCPVDFSCGADGFCGQTSCTTDAECSGACVKGYCYSTRGSCEFIPL